MITKDDIFTNEDKNTNHIKLLLSNEFEGFDARLMIRATTNNNFVLYTGVVNGGQVEFLLGDESLFGGRFHMVAKLVNGDEIASSSLVDYDVERLDKVENIILPTVEMDNLNEVLEKLQASLGSVDGAIERIVIAESEAIESIDANTSTGILEVGVKKEQCNQELVDSTIALMESIQTFTYEKIDEIQTTQGMKGDKGDTGADGIIKNENDGSPFKLWVGTKLEYDSTVHSQDTMYIITD
jgi:hypothetical protein